MKKRDNYEAADVRLVDIESEGFFCSSPIARTAWSVHTTQWSEGSITDGLDDY